MSTYDPDAAPYRDQWLKAKAKMGVAKTLDERVAEASDDHYYGAWAGGKASAGGHPAGPPGGYKALADKAKAGGFTIAAYGGPAPSTGFMVSPYQAREYKQSADTMTGADIKAYIARNSDILHKRGHYVGGWLDDGTIYLDCAVNVATMKDAERMSRKAHQLAAWDVKNKREVRFDEAAKPAGGKPQRPPDALLHADASDADIERFLKALKSGK